MHWFLDEEVTPILRSGAYPANVYEGFQAFLRYQQREDRLKEIHQLLAERKSGPYDTHPALPERLAFLESLPEAAATEDARPARGLLADPGAVEQEISRRWLTSVVENGSQLQPLGWSEVMEKVHAPGCQWRAQQTLAALAELQGQTGEVGPGALLDCLERGQGETLARKIFPQLAEAAPEERAQATRQILVGGVGDVIGEALAALPGHRWDTEIGGSLVVRAPDGTDLRPMNGRIRRWTIRSSSPGCEPGCVSGGDRVGR